MSAKLSQNGKSKKEIILEAAFSFYEETMIKDFSMNELAQRVGLSKPAIYRYFRNKEAVLEAMKNYFFDLIVEEFEKNKIRNLLGKLCGEKIIKSMTVFLAEKPQFINYFICQVMQNVKFLEELKKVLVTRSFSGEFESLRQENEVFFRAHGYFFGASVLFFVKIREKVLKNGGKVKDSEYFSSHLYDFLTGGFKSISNPGDVFFPSQISDERFLELDKISFIKPEYLPEENRIFKAIATVIRKYSKNGVTIERIAGELGMAKSSLYFYFENKNQMLFSLVHKEIMFLTVLCRENASEAKNLSEFIYISMLTEINFFLLRPSLLSICDWLIQTSTEDPYREEKDNDDDCENSVWDKRLGEIVGRIDLGFEIPPEAARFWTGILPVAICVLKIQDDFENAQIIEAVKYIFNFVENGISVERKIEK